MKLNKMVYVLVAAFFTDPVLTSSVAQAELGETQGCFTLAITVPDRLNDSEAKTVVLPTQAIVCTTEMNMQPIDADGILKKGQVKVRISRMRRVVAEYEFSFSSSEGAAGTHYVSYAKSQDDLMPKDGEMNKSEVLTFAMRNDRIEKGEIAGRLEINGHTVYLLQH